MSLATPSCVQKLQTASHGNLVCLFREPDAVTPPVRIDKRGSGNVAGWGYLECTPKLRQENKGPATVNGGERCWCPDKNIPVN